MLGLWFDEEGTLTLEPWKVHETRRLIGGLDSGTDRIRTFAKVAFRLREDAEEDSAAAIFPRESLFPKVLIRR